MSWWKEHTPLQRAIVIGFILFLAWLWWSGRRKPGEPERVYPRSYEERVSDEEQSAWFDKQRGR